MLTNVFEYSNEGVVVAELEDFALAERYVQIGADVLCEFAVGIAAEYFHVFVQSHRDPLRTLLSLLLEVWGRCGVVVQMSHEWLICITVSVLVNKL